MRRICGVLHGFPSERKHSLLSSTYVRTPRFGGRNTGVLRQTQQKSSLTMSKAKVFIEMQPRVYFQQRAQDWAIKMHLTLPLHNEKQLLTMGTATLLCQQAALIKEPSPTANLSEDMQLPDGEGIACTISGTKRQPDVWKGPNF